MSSPTSPNSMSGLRSSSSWQDKLREHCRRSQMQTPIFNIVSDRRGGRTAWSSTVTISGQHIIQARYWYDGQYVNNAKEDAAEVALQQLTSATAAGGHLVGAGGMSGMNAGGMGAQTHHAGGVWRGREGLRGVGI